MLATRYPTPDSEARDDDLQLGGAGQMSSASTRRDSAREEYVHSASKLSGNSCVTIVFSLLSPVLLRVGFVDLVRGENLGHIVFSETGPGCTAASGGRCRMRNCQPVRSRLSQPVQHHRFGHGGVSRESTEIGACR